MSQIAYLKTACERCSGRIEYPSELAGQSIECPHCHQPTPLPPPPTATKQTPPEKPARESKSRIWILSNVQDLVCAVSGLKPLKDFRISYLFSNPFKRRSRSEIDAYLNCGCAQTTPSLAALSSDWPRPWFFWRMLLFGFLVVLIFVVGVQVFRNLFMLPGLFVAGAFFVPLACVALFFELNVLRDISLYQVLKLIVAGGAVSLVLTLFLNKVSELDRLLGPMSARVTGRLKAFFAEARAL
jgi:protease PrsW